MKERIKENLKNYVSERTDTNTKYETNNENFFNKWVEEVDYLKENPNLRGFYPIKNDGLNRRIPWALLKGEGDKTIVLIHHSDVVETKDYGKYWEDAYDFERMKKLFEEGKFNVNPNVQADIDSGEWIFGRGVCDMKGGASIHFTLFEEYSKEENFKGNILVMALPDEENLSAGMRSAIYLLDELRKAHNLEYILTLNVEPQERLESDKTNIYDGSIGKIMPIFFARGKLSHVGQIYSGFNPITLLSQIQVDTELHPNLIEKVGNTSTPAGTWLYMKDRKHVYDVSLPLYSAGYMSILTLKRSTQDIMDELKEIAIDSFDKVIEKMENSYEIYKEKSNMDYGDMNWKANVKFYQEIIEDINEEDLADLEDYKNELGELILNKEIDMAEAGFRLIEKTLEKYDDTDPIVVLALVPPYYPSTNNSQLDNYDDVNNFIEKLGKFSKDKQGIEMTVSNYFTGITDLSYSIFDGDSEDIKYIEENTLMWGDLYNIPLELISELSMPILNIGPWGKDLHMYTERVYAKDLYETIPKLVDYTIRLALEDGVK